MKRRALLTSVALLAVLAVGTLAWVRADAPTDTAETNTRSATIIVKMPANVPLTIHGKESYKVQQMGSERVLHTPPLPSGKKHTYTLEWSDEGKTETKDIEVSAGQTLRLELEDEHTGHKSEVYQVSDNLTIPKIPADAKQVEIWYWLPADSESQKVLNLAIVKGPKDFKIVQRGPNQYLYAKIDNPGPTLNVEADFTIRCNTLSIPLNSSKATTLTADQAKIFSPYLARNVPNMEVNDDIIKLADQICGKETNFVKQVELLYNYLVDNTVGDDTPEGKDIPTSDKGELAEVLKKRGSADHCLKHKGGSCIDQHALFSALARARGIPTRLQFGSHMEEKTNGKDPGYHCWAQYFVPGFGWVPLDVAEGNANKKKAEERKFFMSGIDAHRIAFFEGRDTVLSTGDKDGPKVNLMIVGHVEVDGKPLDPRTFERTLKFTPVKD